MTRRRPLKIVTIGGGSGQFILLSGLRDVKGISVTSVVSMVDSGGSTGRLRDELGVLPPGDILKCILALAPDRDIVRRILQTRFARNRRLKGHNAGNMLLTFLTQYTGDFSEGVAALAEILGIRGRILPVTTDRATLVAELTDGSQVFGEAAIDVPRGDQREKIRRSYLVPHHSDRVSVHKPVLEYIQAADFIVIGPGDVYTSIVPSLIVPGVAEALSEAKARIIYNVNIMTKFGETNSFKTKDFVDEMEKHMRRRLDVVVLNSRPPSRGILSKYREEKSEWVDGAARLPRRRRAVRADLLDESGGIVRHDPDKLAAVLQEVFFSQGGGGNNP